MMRILGAGLVALGVFACGGALDASTQQSLDFWWTRGTTSLGQHNAVIVVF